MKQADRSSMDLERYAAKCADSGYLGYTQPEKQKASPHELAYLLDKSGAACRNRTDDLPLTRRVLYQLS